MSAFDGNVDIPILHLDLLLLHSLKLLLVLFGLVSKLFLKIGNLRLIVSLDHLGELTFRSSVTLFWAINDPGPTDPRAGTDRVLAVAGGPIVPLAAGLVVAGNEARGLTGDLTALLAKVLRTEAVLALLSLRTEMVVDF
jgi:hypothetical protein